MFCKEIMSCCIMSGVSLPRVLAWSARHGITLLGNTSTNEAAGEA